MNQFKLAPRTSPSLDEAAVVLSSEEVEILLDALLTWTAVLGTEPSPEVAHKIIYDAEGELDLEAMSDLADRLLTVRDSGIDGGATS
ncbi:uncharacterized protein METZ01_LOCUS250516 [marine metagenome]|uniref:Uncharacterized protein n=1 Tax=marine metagenome TaxID=408172 RepID=A0A382IED8_9ZZZZ